MKTLAERRQLREENEALKVYEEAAKDVVEVTTTKEQIHKKSLFVLVMGSLLLIGIAILGHFTLPSLVKLIYPVLCLIWVCTGVVTMSKGYKIEPVKREESPRKDI